MLEELHIQYATSLEYEVTEVIPHLVGPPGCGKSTNAVLLAREQGVRLHVMNVNRLNPIELEGVQMPVIVDSETRLKMLTATFWTRLEPGDVVLFDEFVPGFDEVYRALLDVFTSHRVGDFVLPPVFIMAASNKLARGIPALQDRLLDMPVPDPRKSKVAKDDLARYLLEGTGMMPDLVGHPMVNTLLEKRVLPMFSALDSYKKEGSKVVAEPDGVSIRHLIGQLKLRSVRVSELKALVDLNNELAMAQRRPEHVVLLSGRDKDVPDGYGKAALQMLGSSRLTSLQAKNLKVNIELIELEEARRGT